jgi:hypothetical protein
MSVIRFGARENQTGSAPQKQSTRTFECAGSRDVLRFSLVRDQFRTG